VNIMEEDITDDMGFKMQCIYNNRRR
jgi:hypothetical protein